jgi:hypothetical protein
MSNRADKSLCAWVFALVLAGNVALADTAPPLLVAYFIPKDREAIPGYVERLNRVMIEVQSFYRGGMQAAGYGPMTFGLERDKEGKLIVHVVSAAHPMRTYGRDSSEEVRNEVKVALARAGVEVDTRTVVIFEVLIEWRDGRASEIGPYVGGGNCLAGTAWVYDDALLDPRSLDSKEAGGFYGERCSIGEFNSHYVGGVAHELGHAFGLPHVAGPKSIPKHSLMGDGNHTYGAELRGQGSGTYLHPASAMLLSRCTPFAGHSPSARGRPASECTDLRASFHGGQLLLEGKLDSAPPVFGVVAYNDRTAIPADYDATGWISPVDNAGRFKLAIGELEAGDYELRLQVCHTNGATSPLVFHYAVNPDGVPDLSPFSRSFLVLSQAVRAYGTRSNQRATALLDELDREPSAGSEVRRQARHLRGLLRAGPRQSLAALPKEQARAEISQLEFTEASVGWGPPLQDQVLSEEGSGCFLKVDGAFHERGLFAHAPSQYVLDLAGGGWKRFTSGYGLQDGHAGSVIFVIRADGRELFRSSRIDGHKLQQVRLDIIDVKRLELAVEDAGDGPTNDWGVWIEPALGR